MKQQTTTTIDAAALYGACKSKNFLVREKAYQHLCYYLRCQLKTPPFVMTVGKATVEDQEDCLQEALMAICKRLRNDGGPTDPDSFLSWAACILKHKIIDWHRLAGYRKSKQKSPVCKHSQSSKQPLSRKPIGCKRIPHRCLVSLEALHEQDDESTGAYSDRLADPNAVDPAKASEDQEFWELLLNEIVNASALNPVEIAVIRGSFLQGQTDQEIAEQLAKSPVTIRVNRKRGLDKLETNERLWRLWNDFCYASRTPCRSWSSEREGWLADFRHL